MKYELGQRDFREVVSILFDRITISNEKIIVYSSSILNEYQISLMIKSIDRNTVVFNKLVK
jgi:hypothetical protein